MLSNSSSYSYDIISAVDTHDSYFYFLISIAARLSPYLLDWISCVHRDFSISVVRSTAWTNVVTISLLLRLLLSKVEGLTYDQLCSTSTLTYVTTDPDEHNE